MRQKRMVVGLVGIFFALGTMAQTKALKVESPMVTEKDFMWYVEQKNVWKDVVRRNPLDEVAWQNYYNAARYMSWYNQEDTTARQVVREMEATIPDSYTFNFCAYRESSSGKGFGDPKVYAEAALARLPEELQFFDYDNWVSYLAMQGDETRMSQMAKNTLTAASILKICYDTTITNFKVWTKAVSLFPMVTYPSFPNGSSRRAWEGTRTRPSYVYRFLQ